eukprot:scaffold41246_cov15-Phaeocystis_antarctica.AAC.1
MLADLLERQGELVEAISLFTEALEGYVLIFGMEHRVTRNRAKHLVSILRKAGQQEKAEAPGTSTG